MRSANVVEVNAQRMESADGTRRALGRNVKGESPRGAGYFEVVEVWTLKERRTSAQGVARWEKVRSHCTREKAEEWVNNKPES